MSKRLLVIDDSTTIQKVVKLAFAPFEIEVFAANSYIEAISESSYTDIEMVIADASLPGIKGASDYQLLQQKLAVPFVILVGSYDTIDRTSFQSLGFTHFLEKPFDASDLISLSWQAIGRSLPLKVSTHDIPPPPPGGPVLKVSEERLSEEDVSSLSTSVPPITFPGFSQLQQETAIAEKEALTDLPLSSAGNELAFTPPAHKPLLDLEEGLERVKDEQPFSHQPISGDFAPPPPPPLALGDLPDPTEENRSPIQDSPLTTVAPSFTPNNERSNVEGLLQPFLREELAQVVRETVHEYCERHFPRLAREALTKEIEKLMEDKARLLSER